MLEGKRRLRPSVASKCSAHRGISESDPDLDINVRRPINDCQLLCNDRGQSEGCGSDMHPHLGTIRARRPRMIASDENPMVSATEAGCRDSVPMKSSFRLKRIFTGRPVISASATA